MLEKWEMSAFWKNVLCINFYQINMYSFLWFVPAIMTFYLLFPLYYKIFSKASNKLVFTGAVIMIWLYLSVFMRYSKTGSLRLYKSYSGIFIWRIRRLADQK